MYRKVDPPAAADCRICCRKFVCRKFVCRKYAKKIIARRISRLILLAVNTFRRQFSAFLLFFIVMHYFFLPCELCSHGISCHRVSVHPSVTSRSCTKMAKTKITQTTPYDSLGSFRMPKFSATFQQDHPQWGAK